MALKFMQRLDPGERMPFGYGIAWFTDWTRAQVVCMPVPFNLLARMLRDAWAYVATISHDVPVNPRAAYMQGHRHGRIHTFDTMEAMGIHMGRKGDDSCN